MNQKKFEKLLKAGYTVEELLFNRLDKEFSFSLNIQSGQSLLNRVHQVGVEQMYSDWGNHTCYLNTFVHSKVSEYNWLCHARRNAAQGAKVIVLASFRPGASRWHDSVMRAVEVRLFSPTKIPLDEHCPWENKPCSLFVFDSTSVASASFETPVRLWPWENEVLAHAGGYFPEKTFLMRTSST